MADPYSTDQYPAPPAAQPPAPLTPPVAPVSAPPTRRLSPLWQTAVIAFVGLTVAGALVALGLFSPNLFVILSLAGTLIALGVAVFAVIQGWRGSQRAARRGANGRAALIALASGAMMIVAAVALAGAIWILLLFFF
ncbi:MAG TPA: hypothetical protein VIC63_07825 [Candidatus Limnocylindria bacterium]|jgi:hypothetical protein